MVNRRSGWVARSLPIACRGGERSLRMLCIALSADLLAARERKRRPWPPPFSALQSTAVTPLRWPGSGVLSWTGKSPKAPPPSTPSCSSATIPPPACLSFQRVPEAKIVKNRLHLDLITDTFDAETGRLLSLGAHRLRDVQGVGSSWTTFADIEGNEFDLIAG